MEEEQRFEVSLTRVEALVLYDYFRKLDEANKLDPVNPAFDPAVHRAIVALYGPLEKEFILEDEPALDHAYRELRERHREMWEE